MRGSKEFSRKSIYERTFYQYSMESKKQKVIGYENYLIHSFHNSIQLSRDADSCMSPTTPN